MKSSYTFAAIFTHYYVKNGVIRAKTKIVHSTLQSTMHLRLSLINGFVYKKTEVVSDLG